MTDPATAAAYATYLRARMVDALRGAGLGRDPSVLPALGRVAREGFVPHFWSLPPSMKTGTPADVQEFWVDDNPMADRSALDLVYDLNRALTIRREDQAVGPTAGAGVTSTASAPRLVASMLGLAQLAPGMHVLEIGTGSGYNAALLQELVGPQGQVTSVDIDRSLAGEASRRLSAAGYEAVAVVAADGYFGATERAPFDRVVATVGCVDVAPAWLSQLAPGGFCVVPLQHGGFYPLTKAEPTGYGASLNVLRGAGFVAIQGHQAGRRPWPHAGRLGPNPEVEWSPLPDWFRPDLLADDGTSSPGWNRASDLAFLVALEDDRAAFMSSLNDGTSSAVIDPEGRRAGYAGPHGGQLRDRLLEVAERWVALGRPAMSDYVSTLAPLGSGAPARPNARLSWTVDRLDHRQTLAVDPSAEPELR